jgi:AmmeMemoRadiSam system protein A
MFNQKQKKELLSLAKKSIETRFTKEPLIFPNDSAFNITTGVFVTLHKFNSLRGCIGYIKGYKDLVPSICEMAQAAAFRDPRFPAVRSEEMDNIRIEISILSELILVKDYNDIVIGRDGLMINHPHGSGLLLPQVPVEWNWDLPTFLEEVCCKAGLPQQSWKDDSAQLYRFSAEIFSEDS